MKSLYRNVIVKSLQKARAGSANLHTPDGLVIPCGNADGPTELELYVHDDAFFREIAHKGSIGLGESYQRGHWSTNDLTGLLRWLLVNMNDIAPETSPLAAKLFRAINALLDTVSHRRNRNTIDGSRENIFAHYDLGNDFYKTFLDPSMTYSSGFYREPSDSLAAAQSEKYDRLCRKLGLTSMHHVLEIGCGWGGFAMHAARHYDCCVTATTISKAQFDEGSRRVKEAGLENRIDLTTSDYRKLEGKFDRIASIEMLEAVGQEFLGEYFQRIGELLEPGGLAGIQVITCPNPLYDKNHSRPDWIQKHIFPGSHLPSTHALIEKAETAGKLEAYHMESFGVHYARTLNEWRERFLDNWETIERQGFDRAFKRKWEYYLAYCEAGFLQRHVNVFQMIFGRADETSYQYELRDQATKRQTATPRTAALAR